MRKKWSFTIPENLAMLEQSIVVEFIKIIPKDWTLRTGTLVVPNRLIISGEATSYTQFRFGSQVDQMICALGNTKPDIVGTLIKTKMPTEVEFGNHNCLGECEVLSPTERVEVACHYIGFGYHGRLHFAKGDNEERETPITCEIFLPEMSGRKLAYFDVEMDEKIDPSWVFDITQFAKQCLKPLESPE